MFGPVAKELLDVSLLIGALLGAAYSGYKAKGIRRNGNGEPVDTFKKPLERPELMSVEAAEFWKKHEDKNEYDKKDMLKRMMPRELCDAYHGAFSDKVVGLGVAMGTLRTDLKGDIEKVDKQIEQSTSALEGVKREIQGLIVAINKSTS